MKKIAILATFVGRVNRGAESFVIELSNHLKEKYQIDIYSVGIDGSLKNNTIPIAVDESSFFKIHDKVYQNNKIYRIACNKLNYINNCVMPSELFQYHFNKKVYEEYLLKNSYDLIFVNNGLWGARFARRLRNETGVPFVVVGHGGCGYNEFLMLKEHPNRYVALGYDQFIWAKKYWHCVAQIYNGVNYNYFASNYDTMGKPHDGTEKIVLDVGALTKFKRHELVIDAVALLDNTKLVILGCGELENSLQRYGRKKLGNRFELKSVPYAEVKKYYQMADVFALPSLGEPFGIVYVEAMAAGLPVVAPDDNIRREIIGEAGILCNCKIAKEFANALDRAMNKKWGDLPQKQAIKFDWKIIAEKYIYLMDDVMNETKNNYT